MTSVVRIATRRSALAMWQAEHVRDLLQHAHPKLTVELVPIVTQGDRILDKPLVTIGGKGLFLKELEVALMDGSADLAVHSMKDVPVDMAEGLELPVVLPRANPFDAWLCPAGHSLQSLPSGSRVGTSSLRRQCQLLAIRPDLEVVDLRGNVDTRLGKLQAGEYDAIILACAGLERLGLKEHITQVLQPPEWLPAGTQGIIGLQCRENDSEVRHLIQPMADTEAWVQAVAERAVSRVLEGSCQVPLASWAEVTVDRIHLSAMVGDPDGSRRLFSQSTGHISEAEALGEAVAKNLLVQGAGEIIRSSAQNH